MNKRLELNFRKTDGKTARITLQEPREDLTEAEVEAAMNSLVMQDVFAPAGVSLATPVSARIVTTDAEVFDFEG
ncbi:DUF2922 domain-containing protein [Anoxynatronum buryatiense]|uniref:DUF2922 domain-containing protein n=1 Tax=Anoxynatronum buryatiense TaxID=489973 RepID=A0AA45WWE7_9CLOT|nr:DUF2922 domain-containing protein [Anoxynatronum buryatiense]SMP57123.1 Protein of unknown function [Anoxynatronum buryatiense]